MSLNEPILYADQVEFRDLTAAESDLPLPPDPRRGLERVRNLIALWWRRFLVVFGIVTFVGALSVFVLPLRYTAAAMIMVGAREPNPLLTDQAMRDARAQEPDVDGKIQLITSPLSLRHVVQELQLERRPEFQRVLRSTEPGIVMRLRHAMLGSPAAATASADPVDIIADELRRKLRVNRIGRSAVVEISYSAADPALATDVANAVARNSAVDDAFRTRLTLTERAGFDLLKAWVVSPATVPLMPSSPNVLVIAIASVVTALGAACSAVLLADYRATRVVLTADQIACRGVRPLGLIPDYGRANSGRSPASIVAAQPQEMFSDSIATLQVSLLPLIPHSPPTCLVLLFASALPFEGKSTTVAGLAGSIAAGGGRVLVIDADLRSPTLHRTFGASCTRGVSNFLDEDTDPNTLVQFDPVSRVFVLAAGPAYPRPLDVLNAGRLHQAIEDWRHEFDFILIDAPPVLPVADARLMVPCADYCVFVAHWGKTGWAAVDRGLRVLTDAGARIAGIVVSRVNAKQLEAHGFGDSTAYGRAHGGYRIREEDRRDPT